MKHEPECEKISVSDQDTSRDPAWDAQFEVPAKEGFFPEQYSAENSLKDQSLKR